MIQKQRRVQLVLISIGFLLFVLTYLYYPSLNKEKPFGKQSVRNDFEKINNKNQINTFENMEYKGLYDFNKPFKVKSEEAYILSEEPDIVYMKNMHVILYLNDNRIVEITSQKGRYNKTNYNCFFEQNVYATDGETKITANNLDLIATKNYVKIYNDVNLDYISGYLRADKIDYDFEKKHFKVTMFNDRAIKMKVIQ